MTIEPPDLASAVAPDPKRQTTSGPLHRSEILTFELEANSNALKHALSHGDHSIRALALGALDRLGLIEPDDLARTLDDPHRDVRIRAIEVSVHRQQVALVQLLDDTDDLVVETTAWALGEREQATSGIIEALSRVATSHDVAICREAAVAALGALGDPAGLPAILQGMTDKATVRRRAVLALAPFDEPEALRAIEVALDDRDRQVRQAAEDLH